MSNPSIKDLVKFYIENNPKELKPKACAFLAAATHYPVGEITRMAIEIFGPEQDLLRSLEIIEAFYER